jgi:hypothetical protein
MQVTHAELNDTATDIETLQVLYGLVKYLEPSLIIESGTYMGHFPLFAQTASPGSLIYTADPRQYHEKSLVEMYKENGLDPSMLVEYRGTFAEMLEEYRDRLYKKVKLAFVDSGPPFSHDGRLFLDENDETVHSIRWHDYQLAKEYVGYGGIIISHDMNQAGWPGHRDMWDEGIHLNGGRGITLHQVREL